MNSIVGNGAIISGGRVRNSVVFNNVFVHSYCDIDQSILMQGGNVGRGVRLRRVVCDKYVTIEDGTVIGENRAVDAERFHISPGGVVVVPKGAVVPREGPVLSSSSLPRSSNSARIRGSRPPFLMYHWREETISSGRSPLS